jgi:catechol 2,3-dioxygenase-like lactoylglutathione lyase family enzyme
MTSPKNSQFELRGVNHLALVSKDMARTVTFYRDVLGMPLLKTLDLPGGVGQHFFFDIGNGDSIAFFWFKDAPEAVPGISSPGAIPTQGNFMSAHGSMNHIAFDVPPEKFDEYHQRLIDKGINVSKILNHDNSPTQSSDELHEGVYVRSLYFSDPDGACLEFACWTRDFTSADVEHDPMNAEGVKVVGLVTAHH